MDIDKLKSKLAANLNTPQSQVDTNARQAPGDSVSPSGSAQKQTPADQPDVSSPKAEQVLPDSFSDNPVDSFLHPARVWPD
jgi:hypothetical protein